MTRPLRTIALLLLVASCGSKTLSPAAARIREGTDADLTDCAFLQKVSGEASDSKPGARAKNIALERAAALGATHVKWIVPCCTSVEANAYRCDLPE